MIRLLAAAALCAGGGCQTPAAPATAAAPATNRDPAVRSAPLGPTADAGPDPDAPRALLAAARERRLRIARDEMQAGADTVALAADAQACAADAHRSWAAQFPDAALALDPVRAESLIGPAGAEALYLEALCTSVWARMQGFTPLIERKGEIRGALLRVRQLAPDLDGAGAERELGALYAALPAHAGGDLEEARKHLLAALERAPQDARNHLVLARTVAVKAQERALFREHLEVAARSPDASVAAQAQALLQREDELFGPAH